MRAAEPRHSAVTPCELPDGIRLLYTDDRGRRRARRGRRDRFGRTRPFREPPAYRGQRNFPGWWWSATTRSHVVYESWLGRHHIIEADRDARVAGIAGQPFALTCHPGSGRPGTSPTFSAARSTAAASSPTFGPPAGRTRISGTSARSPRLPARSSGGSFALSASRTRSGLPTCDG
jgi:hypothetical protein